ncbi:hypothetical protein EDD15DRAFT_1532929 [Pisolithus albus]|nr:hypothetical protein EDD15DRAFT_1532929 [Pisolithus albus]
MRRPLDFRCYGKKRKENMEHPLRWGVEISYRLVPYGPLATGAASRTSGPREFSSCANGSRSGKAGTQALKHPLTKTKYRSCATQVKVPRYLSWCVTNGALPTVCRTKEHVFSDKLLSTEFGLGARKAVRNGAELIKARNCGTTPRSALWRDLVNPTGICRRAPHLQRRKSATAIVVVSGLVILSVTEAIFSHLLAWRLTCYSQAKRSTGSKPS